MALSVDQINDLKQLLEARRRELQLAIREELLQADEARFGELAGQVHDSGEESVADLLVDVELAVIDQHIQALRGVESALRAIMMGQYGVCVDCGVDIVYERLRSEPAATRCVDCQSAFELSSVTTPRL